MIPTIQNRSVIFSSSQPGQLVVVVERAHPEDPAAARRLEVADLEDDGQRLDDEHEADDRQDQDLARDQRRDRERRPEGQRPRVAHDHLGRVDVEPQEAEEAADDQAAQDRQVRLGRLVEQGDEDERHEREGQRAAGEAIEAVGEVHPVRRRDDGERREGDVHPAVDHHGPDERHRDPVDRVGVLDLERRDDGDDDQPEHLLAGADPLPRPGVEVVVERAEAADEDQHGEGREDPARRQPAQQEEQHQHDADDQEAAHRGRALLDLVALRAFDADPLAHAQPAQEPDVRRHQDDHHGERQQDRLDQLDAHRSPCPSAARSSSTSRNSSTPLDAFTRTTSPSRSRTRSRSSAASRSRTSTMRDGSSPAARAPAAIPLAAAPTTTRRSHVAAAAVPTSRCPMTDPLPSSSIWPRTATRRPGKPARRSSAAATEAGRRVVGVVDERHPPEPHDLSPMRRGPASGERMDDLCRLDAHRVADG